MVSEAKSLLVGVSVLHHFKKFDPFYFKKLQRANQKILTISNLRINVRPLLKFKLQQKMKVSQSFSWTGPVQCSKFQFFDRGRLRVRDLLLLLLL